ncbi:MAG: integrase [Bacteroidetes bacterium SW_9_63_38]|nr:MAG: integrase [Bacteroidetes bacterium SW_9_63_38]
MSRLSTFIAQLSSDSTQRAYRTDLQKFTEFLGQAPADCRFEAVAPGEIQNFLHSMKQNELSMATRRRRLSAIRRFYDWLTESGFVHTNPARAPEVSLVSEETEGSTPRFLSKEDVEAIVEMAGKSSASGRRDQALILVIVYGSLRRSEVAALNVEDIRPLGRHWVIDLPSTSSGHGGYVKIPVFVAEAVEKVSNRYETDEGPLWRSFSNRNRGQRLTPDAIYKRIRSIGDAAGLESIDIELLRRSGLRLAFQAGAQPSQIQSQARLHAMSSVARYLEEPGEARLQTTAGDFVKLDVEV